MKDLEKKLINMKSLISENDLKLLNKQQEELKYLISDLKSIPLISSFEETKEISLSNSNNKEQIILPKVIPLTSKTIRNEDITSAANITTLLTKQKVTSTSLHFIFILNQLTMILSLSQLLGSFYQRVRRRNSNTKKYCQ